MVSHMPIKPGKLQKLLTAKFGFVQAKSRSDDHRYFELCLVGLPPIRTKVSHSKTEIGSALEAKIARQLRVHKKFYVEMMGCTRSQADYYGQIRNDPYPPFEIHL
jgi:hypothetical protein